MTDPACILAIDQGTTSSRALVFDPDTAIVAASQEEFPQSFPRPGWVEHDPEAIWQSTVSVCRSALAAAEAQGRRVAAVGLTNQRETTLLWDRRTGRPLHPAIVWQDRRTAEACRELAAEGFEPLVRKRTGLLLDPYFSATKLAWLLEHVDGAAAAAAAGRLAFGTVDSFLVWRLTGGRVHATDVTNAARTMLFDIHRQCWDEDMLRVFGIPASVLPEVRDCSADYGATEAGLLGRSLPILGVAGDQHAATLGQCCFEPGTMKCTYGTGAFLVVNTGASPVESQHRLLTTIAWRLDGRTCYALEGAIFVAGASVQWLRDQLHVIATAAETDGLARGLEDNRGLYLVPAFSGLGAPWWDPEARGALVGLTRACGPAELARAALESVAYQTHDLIAAMHEDGIAPTRLRVDGGMVANEWLLQFLADILQLDVDRPEIMETTALGAAYLAGRRCGVFGSFEEFAARWRLDARFRPRGAMPRQALLAGWRKAVQRVLS